jgi:putative oxidoreductase
MIPYQQFLIGGAGGATRMADAGLLIIRLFAGLALALGHGINKIPPAEGFVDRIGGFGFPLPEAFAWFSGFAEFGAGLLLAIGLLTRPAAALLVINFIVALTFAHLLPGDTYRGMALALFFFFTAWCFLLAGAGRYSLDGFIRARVESKTVSRYTR